MKRKLSGSREGFSVRGISDDLFDRMKSGKTYKDDCTVPREDLRYLTVLHRDKDGNIHQGEMVAHRLIADDLLEIFESFMTRDTRSREWCFRITIWRMTS